MKQFTIANTRPHGCIANALILSADRTELVHAPTDWQKRGLQQTASGYGRKLNSGFKIHFDGKLRRLYATCYSNAASVWFEFKGQTVYVA